MIIGNKVIENKDTVVVDPTENFMNKLKIFEDSASKNQYLIEEERRRQKLYEQNRKNMRERMRKLKDFINEKNHNKSNEEFYEENKHYFEQFGVKSYDELMNLINTYDKENAEEAERQKREKFSKSLTIEHLTNNDIDVSPDIRLLNNLKLSLNSNINNFDIKRSNTYYKNLENCNKTNEYNFIANRKDYLSKKSKNYEIKKFDNDEIPGFKKLKYNNETELIRSSNIANITCGRTKRNSIFPSENFVQNGIPIDELRNRKIKNMLLRLSDEDKNNYNKVEEIIEDINNKDNNKENKNNNNNNDNNNDINDNQNNNLFLKKNDIFCIDCNESFNPEMIKNHQNHCILYSPYFNNSNNVDIDIDIDGELNINDIDYNANLNKIYEILKKDQNKILKNGNNELIDFYGNLLYSLYEIIINNNSIEDLNSSIITINNDYKKENESENICQFFKDYFSFYVHRIIKLAHFKEKKIEQLLVDLEEENADVEIKITELNENQMNTLEKKIKYNNDNNTNNKIEELKSPAMNENFDNINKDFDQYNDEEKMKYFLKLGLNLKFKYGKNDDCITELYFKAKEQNIEPNYYEDFLSKELNVLKT